MKKFISLIFVLLGVILVNGYIFNKNKTILITQNEKIKTDTISLKINDIYNADYTIIDELNYNFDKYLAVEIEVENITAKEIKFNAFKHIYIDDGNNLKSFLIDENKKKFGGNIKSGETYKLTLTFPVQENNEYILYYNQTLKEEDYKKLGIEIDATNLVTKSVEHTVDHFDVEKALRDLKKETK